MNREMKLLYIESVIKGYKSEAFPRFQDPGLFSENYS